MNKKGFTLIELLVVVAIIGILSAIVVSVATSAKVTARDGRRMADLGSMKTAIELYIDKNGVPPGTIGKLYKSNVSTDWTSGATSLQNILTDFLPLLPKDPQNGASVTYVDSACGFYTTNTVYYQYETVAGGYYKLGTRLEKNCSGINDGGAYTSWYEIGNKLDSTVW